MDNAEEYRRLAAQCVRMAAVSTDPQFKITWIDMAGAWLKLANQVEKTSEPRSAGKDSS